MSALLLALVPLLLAALAGGLSRRSSHRLSPRAATVLLTVLAVSAALATGLLLCLAAVVSVSELAPALTLHHWSPARLRRLLPLPAGLGLGTGVLAATLLASAAVHARRVLGQLHRSQQAARSLVPAGDDLVVLADQAAIAYALPGRPGRVVLSTGLLQALSAPQRRAVLAHEVAHLRHHHYIYVQLGRLATAANPLLRPVSRTIELAVERWADEVAADQLGDRAVVAHAVARAAGAARIAPPVALALAETDVVTRVRSLVHPVRPQRLLPLAYAVAIAGIWLSSLIVLAQVHALMELAEAVAPR